MSTINPATPAVASTSSTGSTSSTTPGGNILDKNAFLKLMMTQLKNQNPLSPNDPTQYINELSQLTTLEQTTNLAKSSSQQASEQHTVATLAMLGHTVTYTDSKGTIVSGKVDKVQFTGSGPMLTVAGNSGINPSTVTTVS
jgi:flagellar basal-body rod modification protein FlgD